MALLEDYRNDFVACHRCVFCKFIPMEKIKSLKHSDVCPSITKYNINAYSGGGKLSMGFALLDGRLQYTEKMLHAINNCNMCGACDVSCKYNIDMELLEPLYEIRNQSVEDGHTVPALDKVISNLKKTNSMVEFKNKRGDWAEGLGVKDASKEKTDVLYFVGCQTSYNKNLQKLARATVKILQNAGVDFGILGDAEMCCAGRAYQMGYQSDFLNEAKKNVALFKKAKIKTIVTGCGDCYHAFKVLYDKFDLKGGLEVLHITEYIDRLIKEGKLKPKKKVNLNVTYHDPCHLGRQGEPWIHWKGKELPGPHRIFEPTKEFRRGTYGIYEPPRDILKSIPGLKLVEMDRIKEYAWCCGAGGGVSDSNPEFSMWTAKERIEEAISTGAEAIVTACPWCEQNFTNAIKEMGSSLKVYDVVELL
jgi:Fe-S oxidoreductase